MTRRSRAIAGVRLLALFFVLAPLWVAAAPDVVLKDFDERARNVNEFVGQGRYTVVTFWAHDCPICQRDIHEMAFFHDAHQKRNDVLVLGVSIDGQAKKRQAQQFVDEHGLDFVNLLAEPSQVSQFGAGALIGTPTYYIYSPQGDLIKKRIGAMTQEELEAVIARAKGG
jgi:peroxiredoxin